MDFSTIGKAGLSDAEAASILGVSKVMMWKYTTGKAQPRCGLFKGVNIHRRAEVMLLVLGKLVEKGSLPKPDLAITTKPHPEIKQRREAMLGKIKKLIDERVDPPLTNL